MNFREISNADRTRSFRHLRRMQIRHNLKQYMCCHYMLYIQANGETICEDCERVIFPWDQVH